MVVRILGICLFAGTVAKLYDFDDDNTLRGESTVFKNIIHGNLENVPVVDSEHHLFNPYPCFALVDGNSEKRFVWPRGFPLNFIHDPKYVNL